MTAPALRRACVVGVGLLGGSVALGLRRAGLTVVGFDEGSVGEEALERRAVDEMAADLGAGVEAADLVILATPVLQIAALLPEVGAHAAAGTLITDVGSTKRVICQAARQLPGHVAFVGGHPMAGRATAGLRGASADLPVGAPWVLCPVGQGGAARLPQLEVLVEKLGAFPLRMTPELHDRTVARLSHLPQLLAMALMELGGAEELQAAGPGFREMTRLASSPGGIWEDVLATNADEIRAAATEMTDRWKELVEGCLQGNAEEAFKRANALRARLEATRR